MSAENQDELWFVELVVAGERRTRAMTLEELDAAYQAGHIEEHTRLRRDGSSEWSTLARVAGLEDEAFANTLPSTPPPASGPHSLSPQMISSPPPPVAFELAATQLAPAWGDEVPEAAFRRSKKPIVFGLAGAALVVVVAIVGLTRAGVDASKALPAAAAGAAFVPPPPAAVDPAPPQAATPTPTRLNDDQKRALAEVDKKREAESAKKAKDRAERASQQVTRRPRGKSNEPFVKGGSKFDPLNGAL